MELNEYQLKALETANYPQEYKIVYPTLGLTGEAGEVSDKVKKVIRDNNHEFSDDRKREIAKEITRMVYIFVGSLTVKYP